MPVRWSEPIGIKVLLAEEVKMKKRHMIVSLIIFGLLFFVSAVLDHAVAGEKIKHHGPGVSTKWQQIEVGDEEGHVIAISETKQIYFDEKNGERFVSVASNVFDINLKTGQGNIKGYGISTYSNGDKTYRTHEGKPVGKGHWKGTWAFTKGTGKYEGVVGGGSWESKSLSPGMFYYDIEGEMKLKTQ